MNKRLKIQSNLKAIASVETAATASGMQKRLNLIEKQANKDTSWKKDQINKEITDVSSRLKLAKDNNNEGQIKALTTKLEKLRSELSTASVEIETASDLNKLKQQWYKTKERLKDAESACNEYQESRTRFSKPSKKNTAMENRVTDLIELEEKQRIAYNKAKKETASVTTAGKKKYYGVQLVNEGGMPEEDWRKWQKETESLSDDADAIRSFLKMGKLSPSARKSKEERLKEINKKLKDIDDKYNIHKYDGTTASVETKGKK